MKTQINNLRSGKKNQVLNPAIDYTQLAPATSHTGHAGSTLAEVYSTWKKITAENPDGMTIQLLGEEIKLAANWSLSGKSVSYTAALPGALKNVIPIILSKQEPYIMISNANDIIVSNGKNCYIGLCPSLITIL